MFFLKILTNDLICRNNTLKCSGLAIQRSKPGGPSHMVYDTMSRGWRTREAVMQKGGVLSTGLQSFPNKLALQWQSTVKETGWARELGPVIQWKHLRSLKQLTLAGWVIHLPPSWLHSFAYLIILLSGLVEITICELVGSEVIRFSPVSLIICKSGKIIPSFGLRQRGLIKHEKREKKRHTQRGARYGKNFLYSAFRISWGWGGMIRHLWISKRFPFARK